MILLYFLYFSNTYCHISGRSLSNSVINLGIRDQYADALSQLGFDFEVVAEQVTNLAIILCDCLFTLPFFIKH